jgi:hypothetical protein
MSNEVIIREEAAARTIVEPNRQEILAQVVEAVRNDIQRSPAAFLNESAVPHGGE